MTIGKKIALGFGMLLTSVAALALVFLYSLADTHRQFSYVIEHDAIVIANARHLLTLVVDMETGQRGFVITGEEEFLEPYENAGASFASLLKAEKVLVSDNPAQVKLLEGIDASVQEWKVKAAEPEIAIRRRICEAAVDASALQRILSLGVGKALMDEFMSIGHELEVGFSGAGHWEGAFAVEVIEKCMRDREAGLRGFLITGEKEFLEKYIAGEQMKLPKYFLELRRIVSESGNGNESLKAIDRMEKLAKQWTRESAEPEIEARWKMNERPESLLDVAALLEFGPGKKILDRIKGNFGEFIAEEENLTAMRFAKATQASRNTVIITILLTLASVIAGVIVAMKISKGITKPIHKLERALSVVATGDLDEAVEIQSDDEIGHLSQSFNKMVGDLKRLEADRSQAEKKLRDTEKRNRVWLESSPVCTKIVDLDFNLQYMSAAGVEGLGIDDVEEFYGKPYPFDFYPESFRSEMTKSLKLARDSGEVVTHEASVVDTDGTELWFHSTLVPVNDDEGELDYILVVSVDTTERNRLEAERIEAEEEKAKFDAHVRHRQKLESIGTLAGGIAHDFNNIIQAIMGFNALAREKMNGSNEELALCQQQIAKGCRRASDLVNQILTFSRETDIELAPQHLQPLIEETLKFLRNSIPVTIRINSSFETECRQVLANATGIHQVVTNLCTNAMHSMEEKGGVLKVSLEPFSADSSFETLCGRLEPGAFVRITVADTGMGIEPETMKRVLEPFFTTKEVGKGTGLGLAMVHGIVKSMRGGLFIDSEVGTGTTVQVILPVLPENQVVETHEESTLSNAECGGRVMIVDDEEAVTKATSLLLEHRGFTVESFNDVGSALEALGARPKAYDVALLDYTMPGRTGVDLASDFLSLNADMPVVIMTGLLDSGDYERIKSLNVVEIIKKPFDVNALVSIINRLLSHDRRTSKSHA